MKKLLIIACVATAFLTGCKEKKTMPDMTNTYQTDSLNDIIAQKDSEINDMLGTLNDIEDGFRKINEAENRMSLAKSGEGASRSSSSRRTSSSSPNA